MNQEPESQECIVEDITKTSCHFKNKHYVIVDGKASGKCWYQWDIWKVSDLKEKKISKAKNRPPEIRCPHCHGPIKLHFKGTGKKWKEDHFEHLGKKVGATDRATCKAGEAFEGGEHQMSIRSVE